MLGAVSAVATVAPAAQSSATGMLGAFAGVAAVTPDARSSAPGMLGAVSAMAMVPLFSSASAASPLGAVHALSYHDFTGQLGDAITRYVMDLTTPGGLVRVPISSWQATLQTGGSNYVQCVVPAVLEWVARINEATAFAIVRVATPPGGAAIEYEMAAAPLGQIQVSNGPTNYTATLSGYSTAFAADEAPDAAYDRALSSVRSISSGTGGYRVRCAIDWLLRPGHRAILGAESFVVGYINYYATSGNDRYMDVGSA